MVGLGLRFDLSTAAMWALPTFLLALTTTVVAERGWLGRLRLWSASLYAFFWVVIVGIDLVYFDEYNDQFNQHLFGLVHDDTSAILITIWKEYHPLLFLAAVVPASLLNLFLIRRWLAWTPAPFRGIAGPRRRPGQIAAGVCLFLLMATLGRGGLPWGEPIRPKHAFVVNDLFLNHMVFNPLTALRHTLEEHFAAQNGGGLAAVWPEGDVTSAARTFFRQDVAPGADLDRLLTHSTPGLQAPPPRHVFLILNESHSGWTVMPEYRHIGLSPQVSALADRGIYFRNFVASTSGTIGAVNSLLTDLPDAGLNINYEPGSLTPYPSAIAPTFKRLGYTTRFFYGGFLGWQRLDSYAIAQGFDEVYGGGNMSAGVRTNEWGVDDADLFDFVLRTIDDTAPSFNLILTTSNHPPYDLDLEALGFPVESLPPELHPTKAETMRVLGHLWYSDREIGRFVARAEKEHAGALFAITGDHTARLGIRFPGDGALEGHGVPFVLYGPDVLPGAGLRPDTPGSQIDIPPTLYALAAPKGFEYVSFGRNLLDAESPPHYALGHGFIVGEDVVLGDRSPPPLYRLPGEAALPSSSPADFEPVVRRFAALKALSWYRVRHGATLP